MNRSSRSKISSSIPSKTTRKYVLGLVIFVSLFLVGTVLVLSSISYYLAIPSWAFLTEEEVAWQPDQVIRPLRDEDQDGTRMFARSQNSRMPKSAASEERQRDLNQSARRSWLISHRSRGSRRSRRDLDDGFTDEDEGEIQTGTQLPDYGSTPGTSGILGSDTIAEIWEELEPEGISTTKPTSASSVTETTSPNAATTYSGYEENEDDLHNPNPTYVVGLGVDGWTPIPVETGKSIDESEAMDDEEEAEVGTWEEVSPTGEDKAEIGGDSPLEHGEEGGATPATWDDWGVDGKGSGGYWMKADWDGRVEGTKSWDRLDQITSRPGEKIPRLIHQTWKNDLLPAKWQKAWKECREGMPDYEYMLWTDDLSRQFIAEHYPAQLAMFDSYKYPIQRADAIRYFILHRFGGIYTDLDIGCRRRLEPLLSGDWEVILPITKPVGISNDLIFSSKESEFMNQTIHHLDSFNHEYIINYPTVMFSTGPMFLSAQYAIYTSSHPVDTINPRAQVRILPKSLYGKNAPIESVPHSFFSHFYGSSWHDDDADFIGFLGNWGTALMYVGVGLVLVVGGRLFWLRKAGKGSTGGSGNGSGGQYQLLPVLPTSASSGTISSGSPTSPPWNGALNSGPQNGQKNDLFSTIKKAGSSLLSPTGARSVFGLLQTSPQRGRRPRKSSVTAGISRPFIPPNERGFGGDGYGEGHGTPHLPLNERRDSSSENTIRAGSTGGGSSRSVTPRDAGMEEVDNFLEREGRASEETEDGNWDDWERDDVG